MLIIISILLGLIFLLLFLILCKICNEAGINKLGSAIKKMVNKIIYCSHLKLYLISLIALFTSVATLCIFWFRIDPFEFSNDSFIGTIATFIGICATFIVGFQIFNSIQVRNELKEIRELNNDLNGRLTNTISDIERQNSRISEIEELSKQVKENLEQVNQAQKEQEELGIARIRHIKAYALSNNQLYTAYFNFIEAIDTYIKLRHRGEFIVALNDIDVCVDEMRIALCELRTADGISKKELLDKFECESIESRNLTIRARIDSWKTLPEYRLLPSRFEYLEAIEVKRKEIMDEVLRIYNEVHEVENNQ